MRIDTRLGSFSSSLLLLMTFTSALYFPQSDLTLKLPFLISKGGGLKSDIVLVTIRALRNDSTNPKDPKYQIVSPRDKFAYLDSKTDNVMLHAFPKDGGSNTIIAQARERNSGEAVLEIKVQPHPTNFQQINCTAYVQDICFWNTSKYRVYENQPITLLGRLGPLIYQNICPDFHISRYELLNGTDYFHIVNNSIFSNASLDRDILGPPGGPGPHVNVRVRCVIWEEKTGVQHALETTLNIDILDQDDNPPIAQTKSNVEMRLRDFIVGDRLDDNDLMVKDADEITSNHYTVRILGDIHEALNITYDTFPIEDPKHPEKPTFTAIYTRIYSRTTLLPKSPYRVILQIRDESLLPGHGNKSVNISLSFIGPQHHTTTSTTASPQKHAVISFPTSIKLARLSSQYFRVIQPINKPSSGCQFTLQGPKSFNITKTGGIIYVANTTLLKTSPSVNKLRIEWKDQDRKVFSTNLTIDIVDVPHLNNNTCNQTEQSAHSCANAETRRECETSCGIAAGALNNDTFSGECVWRSSGNNLPSVMTERYKTCSPALTHCPDYECDDLERLDHRICPQDCTIESEVHFGVMNKDGRGIRSGVDTCSCNDMMLCTCGPASVWKGGGNGGGNDNGGKDGNRSKKDRDKDAITLDARKASSSPCGPGCLVGVIGASLFVLVVIVGTFITWRYRMATKDSRRECKNRADGGGNGLGILPSDYVDRGDGLLIGLDSLTTVNRTLLLPKTCPPDPKWEFPRSKLTIEQVLGEGEFGRVLRAKAIDINGWPGPTTVAVKTLKEGACTSELADLLSEYQLLKEAQHPNVIRLLGACTSPGGPVYLIIEFAEFGSLRNYLRRSRHLESEGRPPCSTVLLSTSHNARDEVQASELSINYGVTPRDILSFAWQISKGMSYLADIKLVHRDLAARNVLLATGKVCKISDFGLTRDVYEDDAYLKRSKGRVPVKWMAPESLADHVYTSKSDVWSFGVLLWELVTLGASPYPGVDVHNLYNLLKAGYRMEKPANCSQQLYKLMVSCWHEEPGMRLSFKELTNHWERMLEDGVEYLDLNPRTVHNQAYFTSLHALDSPTNSGSNDVGYGNVNTLQANTVNYLSKPSTEPITKCDKVDKLHAFWQEPIASFPEEPLKPPYANDQAMNLNVNHYESPIKLRSLSVSSNSENNLKTLPNDRPQSYIDMEGKKSKEQEDLLLFNNVEKKIDVDTTSNGVTM